MTARKAENPLRLVPKAKCHYCGGDDLLVVLCWREHEHAASRHEFYCQVNLACWAAYEHRYNTLQTLGFLAADAS